MKLFAIGDLHLSTALNKPMNIFGDNWENHEKKIFKDWKDRVSDEDIVLIVGDISWASKLNDAKEDLDIINSLPGKKYFIKGNHDYWWTTATSLNKLYGENMIFMNTNYQTIGDYALCGTRGWVSPNDVMFKESDEEIYLREANRLKLSLEKAKNDGYDNFIIILHYPPTNDKFEDSLITELIDKYRPEHVIYGHLHGKDSFPLGLNGKIKGVNYHLVSCDYLDFKLKEIELKLNEENDQNSKKK